MLSLLMLLLLSSLWKRVRRPLRRLEIPYMIWLMQSIVEGKVRALESFAHWCWPRALYRGTRVSSHALSPSKYGVRANRSPTSPYKKTSAAPTELMDSKDSMDSSPRWKELVSLAASILVISAWLCCRNGILPIKKKNPGQLIKISCISFKITQWKERDCKQRYRPVIAEWSRERFLYLFYSFGVWLKFAIIINFKTLHGAIHLFWVPILRVFSFKEGIFSFLRYCLSVYLL